MKIEVVTAPGCTRCHDLTRMLEDMSLPFDTIDATAHPEYLRKHMIMTAPALIIDDHLVYAGVPNYHRLRRLLTEQQRLYRTP